MEKKLKRKSLLFAHQKRQKIRSPIITMSPSNSCGRPCACSKEKNITIQAEEGSSKEINRLSIPISKDWKRAPNAEDQFASYHDDDGNKTVLDEENPDKDPWIYSGNRLRALQFPLGGFGM